MNDDFIIQIAKLNEPPPPASLKAVVMARIARDADAPRVVSAATTASPRRQRDRLVWLWMFAGLAIVGGASAYGWFLEGTAPNLTSPRFAPVTMSLIPQGDAAMVIGLGLLVYLAGLFRPLRRRGQTLGER